MRYKNINSGTHPIHQDILPILSALKLGNRRAAKYRLDALITRLDLVYWEQLVVANMINEKRKERERSVGRRTGKSRLEHWAQLRRDYPAIESMAKNVQTPSAEHPTQRYKLNKLINVIRFAHAAIGVLIMNEMTPAEIREFYDRNINMTLLDLSCETGLTIPELKKILLKDES